MRFLQLGRHTRGTDYSVGIIGGADGPTKIYVSDGAWLWLRRPGRRGSADTAQVGEINRSGGEEREEDGAFV